MPPRRRRPLAMRNFLPTVRRRFLARATASFPLLLAAVLALTLAGCGGKGRDEARDSIRRSGLSFTADEFVKAAGKGDQGMISAFLQAGMDRNSVDSRGDTALMAAAENGQTTVVKALLDENAKPDLQNKKEGATALLLAAAANHPDTVRALIEGNADTRVKDRDNLTPLSKAVAAGYKEVVDVLLKTSADQLKRDGQLDRALATASMMGKTDLMGALIDRGANVNAAIEQGRTPLMYAAIEGNKDAVAFLLDRGANPRQVNAQGANASVLALEYKQVEVSRYIDGHAGTAVAANAAPVTLPATGGTTAPAVSPAPSPAPTAGQPNKDDSASVAMERAWLKQNGVEPTALLNKDLGLDDDKDGFTNDEELAGGTNPNDPLSHPPFYSKLRMKRVEGENFPVLFNGIEGKKIRVTVHAKTADGSGTDDGRQFSLSGGDRVADLPYTVNRVRRRNISEKDTGHPADVSELTLSNVQTGRKIVLVRGMPTNSPDAAAIVSFGEKGEEMSLRQGQKFTLPQDPQTRYEVLDIRPRQVVLRILNSGQTVTISMPEDGSGGHTAAQ